jgi:peroxiredoxin
MSAMNLRVLFALCCAATLAAQQPAATRAGQPAPGFTGTDDSGRSWSLGQLRGRFVVIEWHEKGCPYVTKHYAAGHMQRLQQKWIDRDVAWLLINSSADGWHSYLTPEQSRAYRAEQDIRPTAMILDPEGHIGKAYGATTALHMVVVDPDGRIAYQGAIDDKPVTDRSSLDGAVNFVDRALTELAAGRPVTRPATEPYGCAVHYAGGE